MAEADESAELMLAFSAGEEHAFDALFARWSAPLLRFLHRMVGDMATAEELVQEAFFRVYKARDRYVPDAKFSTWLYRIGTNLALNELRRPARRNAHRSVERDAEAFDREGVSRGGPELRAVGASSDELADLRGEVRRVEAVLDELPERQRAALWLSSVEGLSYAEVAEALEATEKSVKSLVHRARATLVRRDLRGRKGGAGHDA